MIFSVLFEDRPGREDQRQQHMAAHLQFLETLGARVLGAGPLFDGDAGRGGMWLIKADTAQQVRALVEQDPFWPTGLRKSVAIREWRLVLRDGRRL